MARAVKSHFLTPKKPMTTEGKRVMPSILGAVQAGLEEAAGRKNALSETAIDTNKVVIRSETKAAIEASPEFQHLSNTENWWQSRVTIGAIVAIVAGIAGAAGYAIPPELQSKVVSFIVTAGPIIGPVAGGAFALWGRWVSRKPLGS